MKWYEKGIKLSIFSIIYASFSLYSKNLAILETFLLIKTPVSSNKLAVIKIEFPDIILKI